MITLSIQAHSGGLDQKTYTGHTGEVLARALTKMHISSSNMENTYCTRALTISNNHLFKYSCLYHREIHSTTMTEAKCATMPPKTGTAMIFFTLSTSIITYHPTGVNPSPWSVLPTTSTSPQHYRGVEARDTHGQRLLRGVQPRHGCE